MKRINAIALCMIAASASYGQQQEVKGRVYIDANRNNKFDKSEKGLAGVSVSNGEQVVVTDKDGNYVLPVGDDNIIFAVKPSGYSFHLDGSNKPKYYYIHKPNGAPADFKYKGVAPTGKLPASVDFALTKSDEAAQFTALVFGDPQPYTMQEIEYFDKAILGETSGIKNVAFGISLGDLVGDNLDLHQPYIDVVKKAGVPWYNVMGNHDMNYDAKEDKHADETFEKNFGPPNYAFNYGNAHFIVLDDILYPDPRDGKGYWGGFRDDQLNFLANDLKQVPKDKLIVLSYHIPLLTGKDSSFILEHRQRLFDILKDFPNVLSMSAHTHLQRHNFYNKEDGWNGSKPFHEYNAGTTSGDWYSGELNEQGVPVSTMRDGTPKGYAFLRIDGNQYVIDYKVAGKPAEHQINIFNPKVVAQNKRTSSAIYANFFMGGENDVVECKVDNSDWVKMSRVENADPTFLDRLHRWDYAQKLMPGRRPSNAEACTHLWTAPMVTKLDAGTHKIEVRATDMFGRKHSATSEYTVEAQADTKGAGQ